MHTTHFTRVLVFKRNSKIPKGQTEIKVFDLNLNVHTTEAYYLYGMSSLQGGVKHQSNNKQILFTRYGKS